MYRSLKKLLLLLLLLLLLFKFQDAGLQLYSKRGSCIGFFSEIFKTLQNNFFIVQPSIAASDLIEYMETWIII